MENQNNSGQLFDLRFDENVKQHMKGAAATAGMAAILSLAGSLLSLVNVFMQMGKTKTYNIGGFQTQTTVGGSGIAGAVVTLILSGFLFYFLNKFSKLTKAGIDGNNQQEIGEGLGGLATYFKIIGVLLIIGIVLVCLGLLIGIGSKA